MRCSARLHAAMQVNALHWLVLVAALAAALVTPGYRRLLAASVGTRTLEHHLLTQVDGLWYLVTHPLLTLRTNIAPHAAVRTILALDLAAKAACSTWQSPSRSGNCAGSRGLRSACSGSSCTCCRPTRSCHGST
jgi:hypothetical protein